MSLANLLQVLHSMLSNNLHVKTQEYRLGYISAKAFVSFTCCEMTTTKPIPYSLSTSASVSLGPNFVPRYSHQLIAGTC